MRKVHNTNQVKRLLSVVRLCVLQASFFTALQRVHTEVNLIITLQLVNKSVLIYYKTRFVCSKSSAHPSGYF